MRVVPRFRSRVRFDPFQGPADAKFANVYEDGVLIGWIEREVDSEQKPGSSRAWTHAVTGYTAFPVAEGAEEKTFASLKDARAYIVARGKP